LGGRPEKRGKAGKGLVEGGRHASQKIQLHVMTEAFTEGPETVLRISVECDRELKAEIRGKDAAAR